VRAPARGSRPCIRWTCRRPKGAGRAGPAPRTGRPVVGDRSSPPSPGRLPAARRRTAGHLRARRHGRVPSSSRSAPPDPRWSLPRRGLTVTGRRAAGGPRAARCSWRWSTVSSCSSSGAASLSRRGPVVQDEELGDASRAVRVAIQRPPVRSGPATPPASAGDGAGRLPTTACQVRARVRTQGRVGDRPALVPDAGPRPRPARPDGPGDIPQLGRVHGAGGGAGARWPAESRPGSPAPRSVPRTARYRCVAGRSREARWEGFEPPAA
jgi:hypothetical protein